MYKNILQSIDNVAIWPVISFVIFFLFFLFLIWHVLTTDKTFIGKMKNMPLDDQTRESSSNIKSSSL